MRDVGFLFLRMTKIKMFALNEHSWDKKVNLVKQLS